MANLMGFKHYFDGDLMVIYPTWLFNMAMENGP